MRTASIPQAMYEVYPVSKITEALSICNRWLAKLYHQRRWTPLPRVRYVQLRAKNG